MKKRLIKPVQLNKSTETIRHASWLELFIDLGFVIAIASLETLFHHGIDGGNLRVYFALFFTIMWVWNRLTWYSSYYGNDDLIFRIGFIVTLFFILGFSSSVARISAHNYAEALYWYLAIQCVILLLWFRVLLFTKEYRLNTLSFLGGYLLAFVLIAISLFLPLDMAKWLWLCALLLEMTGPVVGWKLTHGNIFVHTPHILERHGLFAIIILGEGLVTISRILVQSSSGESMLLAIMGMGVIALIWWIYFDDEYDEWTDLSQNIRRTFIYGYGQFIIFLTLVMLIFSIGMSGYDKPIEAPFTSGQLMLGSSGVFLLSLGAIQLSTSNLAHFNQYYIFRMGGGALLTILSLSAGWSNTFQSTLVVIIVLITVVLQRHGVLQLTSVKTSTKQTGNIKDKTQEEQQYPGITE